MKRPEHLRRAALATLSCAVISRGAMAVPAPRDLLSELERLEKPAENRPLVKDPATRARAALDRARRLELAGDTKHAGLLRDAAAEWVSLASDLVRTAAAEREAQATEKTLVDTETKTVRARALMEETIARRGRAEAQWAELEHAPKAEKAPAAPPKKGAPQPAKAGGTEKQGTPR